MCSGCPHPKEWAGASVHSGLPCGATLQQLMTGVSSFVGRGVAVSSRAQYAVQRDCLEGWCEGSAVCNLLGGAWARYWRAAQGNGAACDTVQQRRRAGGQWTELRAGYTHVLMWVSGNAGNAGVRRPGRVGSCQWRRPARASPNKRRVAVANRPDSRRGRKTTGSGCGRRCGSSRGGRNGSIRWGMSVATPTPALTGPKSLERRARQGPGRK